MSRFVYGISILIYCDFPTRPPYFKALLRHLSAIPVITFDKYGVDHFLEDAERIFESAIAAAAVDPNRSEVAILLDSARAIRIVDAAGWALDPLRASYGATTVYRVARSESGVCLEGLSGQRSCVLRTQNRTAIARTLLNARFGCAPQTPGRAQAEPTHTHRSGTTALTVAAEQSDYSKQLEMQQGLFGILHNFARPGT